MGTVFSIFRIESGWTDEGNIGLSGRFWFHVPQGGVLASPLSRRSGRLDGLLQIPPRRLLDAPGVGEDVAHVIDGHTLLRLRRFIPDLIYPQ